MNYAAHTEELHSFLINPEGAGADPVVFTKCDSAMLIPGKPFFIPDHLGRIDYEAELVVRICRLGKNISERFAHRYYDAVTVGIDFTARELQQQASRNGLPWTIAKGFDGSAAIGEWVPISEEFRVKSEEFATAISFRLDKNGETVQRGNTAYMIHSIDQLISYISRFFTLKTGDLIYTGTPVGVGPVAIGDHLEGWILNEELLKEERGERKEERGMKKVLDLYCR
jgi:2-keto-4-pentenoate hydratase/2-oxohepta-3-ene-1,7-dioic acid hydratase in catechol pathway